MPRSVGSVDAKLLSDRYEILAPLGVGTAATVYKVRDRRTGVLRAAKVLTPENAANPKVLARFEDEFRILRTLHHPHLAEVYDYGWTEGGGRFLVMELVDGVPLDEYFRSNPTDIWAILYELCETLTFVHDHKLLHQDIKPSNIIVKRTTAYGPELPLVKLIDFGLIYQRDTGAEVELVGTPEYIAPEVARGNEALTRAVDYYSLGVTLYELLVGHPPFQGPESKVLRAHVEQEPVIENEELEWAELYPHVRGLLTKDSRARLEAFEEFRQAVVSRLTGGIEALDRAYKVAQTDAQSITRPVDDITSAIIGIDGRVQLSEVQRRIVECMSCHPSDVPIAWLSHVANINSRDVVSAVDDLTRLQLIQVVAEPVAAVCIRHAASATLWYDRLSLDDRNEYHARYVTLLSSDSDDEELPSRLRRLADLAFHLRRSGQFRQLLRVDLARITYMRRSGARHDVESVCREAIEQMNLRVPDYIWIYVRLLVHSLWGRNLTVEAFEIIDRAHNTTNSQIPRNLVPKYVRGMMDKLGPKQALSYLSGEPFEGSATWHSKVAIERALCLHNLGEFQRSLDLLTEIGSTQLPSRDQCRLTIYSAMNLLALGKAREAERLFLHTADMALARGFIDEFGLSRTFVISRLIETGDVREALRAIARALRIVLRSGLLLRQYNLLSQAASAYSVLGDNRRALKWREKTLRLAFTIGQPHLLVRSLLFVALYSCRHGAYGNALRYYERAVETLERNLQVSAKVEIARLECHVLLQTPHVKSLMRRCKPLVIASGDQQDRAAFERACGLYAHKQGDWRSALRLLGIARRRFLQVGSVDEAVGSALDESQIAVDIGNARRYERAMAFVDRQVLRLEYPDIHARRSCIRLSWAVRRRAKVSDLVATSMECERLVSSAEMRTRFDLLGVLFLAYARMGKETDAASAYDRFLDHARIVVANLDEPVLEKRFLISIGIEELSAQYAMLNRQARNQHAAELVNSAA